MRPSNHLPIKRFASGAAWQAWLAEQHDTSSGVWLEFAKKGSGLRSLSRPEALEIALCYGWIDGQAISVDMQRWRQRFTPRRARSRWSQINCAAVERLYAEGRLAPAGIREMEAAKGDGRWGRAYGSPRTMPVPEDLQAALVAHPHARRAFAQLDGQNRYAMLYRLHDAKRPETRARRLAGFIRMLEAGETLHKRKSRRAAV